MNKSQIKELIQESTDSLKLDFLALSKQQADQAERLTRVEEKTAGFEKAPEGVLYSLQVTNSRGFHIRLWFLISNPFTYLLKGVWRI